MISNFKLPFSFDPELLQSELEGIAADDWVTRLANRAPTAIDRAEAGLAPPGQNSREPR